MPLDCRRIAKSDRLHLTFLWWILSSTSLASPPLLDLLRLSPLTVDVDDAVLPVTFLPEQAVRESFLSVVVVILMLKKHSITSMRYRILYFHYLFQVHEKYFSLQPFSEIKRPVLCCRWHPGIGPRQRSVVEEC